MRALTKTFMDDLSKSDGLLYPILARVKQDETLMLAIRDNYINIYYRGGNILKVKERSKNFYLSSFAPEYNKSGEAMPPLPDTIQRQIDAQKWVDTFPHLKKIMDLYFSKHSKPEREFQQLVARENNISTISNETEYFITDIEFADSDLGARFDMLAIIWSASHRKDGSKCRAALIEMKYGDGALGDQKYDGDCDDKAGMLKHLQDINAFIKDPVRYKSLLSIMETQFNQLDQLGLLHFNHCKNEIKVKLDVNNIPEVIFMLANHNPRSKKLKTILSDPRFDIYEQSKHFDLKFHVASFSGYGLYSDCMLKLDKFRELLRKDFCQ